MRRGDCVGVHRHLPWLVDAGSLSQFGLASSIRWPQLDKSPTAEELESASKVLEGRVSLTRNRMVRVKLTMNICSCWNDSKSNKRN